MDKVFDAPASSRLHSEQTMLYDVSQTTVQTSETLREWLPRYLSDIRNEISRNSYNNYYSYMNRHILPLLGNYHLHELNGPIIRDYISTKLDGGRVDGKGGLSTRTVQEHLLLLKQALDEAVMEGKLSGNPCRSVSMPKIIRKETRALSGLEQARLEHHIHPEFEPNSTLAAKVALYGGLRNGEVCALNIGDIDFINQQITVSKTRYRTQIGDHATAIFVADTKSKKQRTVPLTKELAHDLRIYLDTMPVELKARDDMPLFVNSLYRAVEPKNMLYHFKALLKEADLENIRFHDLRHTFATRCLEVGIDIKVVSQILGHASTRITADLYTHVTPQMMWKALTKLNKENWMQIYDQMN